ncbi:TetR/AcrR family transcriptional regulator, partial [Mycobacterium tuberculosis]|nr:TetR/AcrR family transcriptional regulator [Mycobacterium tuberculosis]
VRAARRFLDVQRALAFPETAEAQGDSDAEAAVTAAIVAAAEAPSVFAERFPDSARLVLTVSREQLLDADLPAELAAELRGAERDLVAVLV